MNKKRRKGILFYIAVIAAVFLVIRFCLSLWGIETACEYIFRKDFSLFGMEFSFAVYSFFCGIPFFGITLTKVELLRSVVKYIPFLPIISGESGIVSFDWGEAGILTFSIILAVGLFCKGKRLPAEEDEEEKDCGGNAEESPEDKSICKKCGKKIFGDNMYCENCGTKKED